MREHGKARNIEFFKFYFAVVVIRQTKKMSLQETFPLHCLFPQGSGHNDMTSKFDLFPFFNILPSQGATSSSGVVWMREEDIQQSPAISHPPA